MNKLELALLFDSTAQRIVATVRNLSNGSLNIGNLNLANLKFGSHRNTDQPVLPWISCHIPNANGSRTLGPNESIRFEYDYLREYKFPAPGSYPVWLIYDSLGFKDRFANGDGPHAGLDLLDEFRYKSPEAIVSISDNDYKYNQCNFRSFAT